MYAWTCACFVNEYFSDIKCELKFFYDKVEQVFGKLETIDIIVGYSYLN